MNRRHILCGIYLRLVFGKCTWGLRSCGFLPLKLYFPCSWWGTAGRSGSGIRPVLKSGWAEKQTSRMQLKHVKAFKILPGIKLSTESIVHYLPRCGVVRVWGAQLGPGSIPSRCQSWQSCPLCPGGSPSSVLAPDWPQHQWGCWQTPGPGGGRGARAGWTAGRHDGLSDGPAGSHTASERCPTGGRTRGGDCAGRKKSQNAFCVALLLWVSYIVATSFISHLKVWVGPLGFGRAALHSWLWMQPFERRGAGVWRLAGRRRIRALSAFILKGHRAHGEAGRLRPGQRGLPEGRRL